jgi:hypothetical protein
MWMIKYGVSEIKKGKVRKNDVCVNGEIVRHRNMNG